MKRTAENYLEGPAKKLGRPRKMEENALWTTFKTVLDYLPPRTLARFKAVSSIVKDEIDHRDIKKPNYADLIDTMVDAAKGVGSGTVVGDGSVVDMDTGYLDKVCEVETVVSSSRTVELYFAMYGKSQRLTKCNIKRLKYILYRMIEKNKKIKRFDTHVQDLFESASSLIQSQDIISIID